MTDPDALRGMRDTNEMNVAAVSKEALHYFRLLGEPKRGQARRRNTTLESHKGPLWGGLVRIRPTQD